MIDNPILRVGVSDIKTRETQTDLEKELSKLVEEIHDKVCDEDICDDGDEYEDIDDEMYRQIEETDFRILSAIVEKSETDPAFCFVIDVQHYPVYVGGCDPPFRYYIQNGNYYREEHTFPPFDPRKLGAFKEHDTEF